MSENQTDVDLIELESLNRSSSLSNNSDSSVSSRSTLIRELITSQTSRKIIDEIDYKISQLVDVIKNKNCNYKRKKYYAKKIVSRIIDNKCSEASIHTFDFRNSDLASSTPYESREKTPKSLEPHKISPPKPQSPEKYKTPSPKDKLIAEIQSGSPATATKSAGPSPNFYDTTPLTNKAVDLKQRLKRLAEEIENYTKTPTSLSPSNEKRISEATEKLEKNLDDLKSSQNGSKITTPIPPRSTTPQKVEASESLNGRPKERCAIQNGDHGIQQGRQSPIGNIQDQNGDQPQNYQRKAQKDDFKTKNNNQGSQRSQQKNQNGAQGSEKGCESEFVSVKVQGGFRDTSNDHQVLNKVDEGVQTSFEYKLVTPKCEVPQKNQNSDNKFENLTPKTLSMAYKSEFGDGHHKVTEIPIIPSEIFDAGDLNGQNKDWKNYKTTSEKIFEKNQVSRRLAKEYIIKYARKEKERQIEWISNEIQSLTKLKEILEKNSVENLSLSSLSSGKNSSSSSKDNFNCTGAKTLAEINICLEELRQILQEKKCIVKRGIRQAETSASSANNTDTAVSKVVLQPNVAKSSNFGGKSLKNVDSGSESNTSYQVLCKKFTKPTDFEVKYFHESNFLSSGSEDKENFINFNENFVPSDSKRNIQIQTSLQCSSRFSRDFLGAGDFNSVKNTNSDKSILTKSKSVAYILTFQEAKNGFKNENGIRTVEKTNLEKVVLKIPAKTKKQRSKLTNTAPSEMELQEALVRNRSDFVKAAEWRRQCINELTYMRDRRYEDINKRILFTTKEMRDITSKRYKYSAEVQNKMKIQQNQLQKLFNRQLANIFSKKLQEKTLKGQVTIDTAKTVTYDP